MGKKFIKNKKGLIIGFIFGAMVAPFLATLGLASQFFEWLRPLLIGPMDFLGSFIPNVQTGPNTYYVPVYKWILTLAFNGICYAVMGWLIQNLLKTISNKNG